MGANHKPSTSSESESGPPPGSSTDSSTDPTSSEASEDESGGVKFDIAPPPELGGTAEIPTECETAANVESAVGCLFYAFDLDNVPLGETQQFGVVVSNVQAEQVIEVLVETKFVDTWSPIELPQLIEPGQSAVIELPDAHQEGSGFVHGGAYRITTDFPSIAYQFNPINGQLSDTTDASLLLPATSWDYLYRAVGYPVTVGRGSYVAIVASVDGTEVEITPEDATIVGPEIPAGLPSIPFTLILDEGDVAQIATEDAGKSLTGTKIESDSNHPIGVFSGTECTSTGFGACDHLEEMLTGLRQWGKSYVAARMPVREEFEPEPTIWQIYASEGATHIEIEATPGVTGIPAMEFWLEKGQTGRFPVSGSLEEPGDFVIYASKPIALVSYMVGMQTGSGDPAMLQASPIAQFLPRYVVLVPETWTTDYLVITRPFGAEVEVDGELIADDAFISVGTGDYEVARVETPDGVHFVDGLGDAIGVSVVGIESYDSYAYIGGMGTAFLNPSPDG